MNIHPCSIGWPASWTTQIHKVFSKLNILNLNLVAFIKVLGIETLPETVFIHEAILLYAFNIQSFGFCALLIKTSQILATYFMLANVFFFRFCKWYILILDTTTIGVHS